MKEFYKGRIYVGDSGEDWVCEAATDISVILRVEDSIWYTFAAGGGTAEGFEPKFSSGDIVTLDRLWDEKEALIGTFGMDGFVGKDLVLMAWNEDKCAWCAGLLGGELGVVWVPECAISHAITLSDEDKEEVAAQFCSAEGRACDFASEEGCCMQKQEVLHNIEVPRVEGHTFVGLRAPEVGELMLADHGGLDEAIVPLSMKCLIYTKDEEAISASWPEDWNKMCLFHDGNPAHCSNTGRLAGRAGPTGLWLDHIGENWEHCEVIE